MNTYEVRKINITNAMSVEDWHKAYNESDVKICYGLKEVWEYCGAKLKRERRGYGGTINGVEYTAIRVK